MPDFHKMALVLSVLWIAAATTMMVAKAQEATFSEGERLGLAACLGKCPDGDKACNNRRSPPDGLTVLKHTPHQPNW